MKYFDRTKKQLIYISHKSTPNFWDAHWSIDESIRERILRTKKTFISQITRKYLNPSDGIILEGGCGTGQYVASLVNNGYRTIGLDYAYKTVSVLNQYVPELEIILGDIRSLPFRDNFFSGYWSLGVIEHFWEGYEAIASEMSRVVKNNGYLFITFPYMSPFRRIKGALGLYKLQQDLVITDDFHQFALNTKLVVADFTHRGFKLINAIPHDGATGVKDEVYLMKPFLQKLLDYKGHNKFIKAFETIFSRLFSPVCGHCILLVFRKSFI